VDVYATADARVVRNAVQGVEGLTPVEACSDLLVKEGQYALPAEPAARARAEELRSKLASADAMLRAGRPTEAHPIAEAALADARALHDGSLEADAAQLLGMTSLRAGDTKSAETQLPQAAVLATRSHSDNVLAQAFNYTCFAIGHEQARYAEGRVWCELALAVADGAGDDALRALARGTIADIETDDGEYDLAIDTYKQVTAFDEQTKGASSLVYAADLNNLALAYRKAGRYEEALAALRRSLAIKERAWGPIHPSLALSTNNIGMVCYDRHDYECALDYYRRALQMLEQTWGPTHPYTGLALTNVGTILEIQGKYDEALGDFQKADAIWEKTKRPDHPDYALLLTGEGRAYLGQQMPERAISLLERALDIRLKAAGILPKDLARTRFALARALWGAGAGRDRARARVLAIQAREGYAALGEDQKAELAEADEWLVQHPSSP
jgi:tetratricopeptide (TPR) repeat protein